MTTTTFSNKFYEELEKNAPRVDIRQTVLTGPKDANGVADFLQAGTGLQATTKNLSTDPLVLTAGDGFSPFGQRDVTVERDTTLTWDSLPASEATIYLYVDILADGTLQAGHTLLEPVYSLVKPSVPASEQAFYPTDHAHRMEVYDGAQWVRKLRVFVGECTTDATDVTAVVSYRYESKGLIQDGDAPLYGARAWVTFDGTNGNILKSQNVSNVIYNSSADYTVEFERPMADVDYAMTGTIKYNNSGSRGTFSLNTEFARFSNAVTRESCRVWVVYATTSATIDAQRVTLVFFN